MPLNGSGSYSAPAASFPAVASTLIESAKFNAVINDIGTALSTAIYKDGQQTITANIPFAGFRATNIGITGIAGTPGVPAINLSDSGTGFYRSALNAIGVTINTTETAFFTSAGFLVNGAVAITGGAVVVSTPVITATQTWNDGGVTFTGIDLNITNTASAAASMLFNLRKAGTSQFKVDVSGNATALTSVITPIVDSGSTGSLLLKTNNGTSGFEVIHRGSGVTRWRAVPGITANEPIFEAAGETNTGGLFDSFGTGGFKFRTDSTGSGTGALTAFEIVRVASAARWVKVSPSAAGNPTLDVTAGSLAITPAVVMASTVTTLGGATFHTTSSALTDGAGVGAGTLGTAPSAGNPTKWIGINDNGTTRYIPAW